MMVKFPIAREGIPVDELARQLQECGQRSIMIPADMLKKKAERKPEK
jgi:hypothetical protein